MPVAAGKIWTKNGKVLVEGGKIRISEGTHDKCCGDCCDISGTWQYSYDYGGGPTLEDGGTVQIWRIKCCQFGFLFLDGPLVDGTGVFNRVDGDTWRQVYDGGFEASADVNETCDRLDFYDYGGSDFWVR